MRKVSDVLEDLEAAPHNRGMGTTGMLHRDDRVTGAPDDERREIRGELQPVVRADSLSVDADDGPEGGEERRPAERIGERRVAAADLLGGRSRAEADSPSPLDDGASGIGQGRSTEEPEHLFGAGKGEGPQQQVHLAAEAAAADQHEALAELGELVGELHGHTAAERVADERRALVPEDEQQVAEQGRVGAQRIVAGRLRRLPVAEKIRREDREPAGQAGADRRPCRRAARHPVDEQEDGPFAGKAEPHPMAMQGHGMELHAGSVCWPGYSCVALASVPRRERVAGRRHDLGGVLDDPAAQLRDVVHECVHELAGRGENVAHVVGDEFTARSGDVVDSAVHDLSSSAAAAARCTTS